MTIFSNTLLQEHYQNVILLNEIIKNTYFV